MVDQRPARPRSTASTAWKWASLGLLALVLPVLPVLAIQWVVTGLGDSDPTHDPAGGSFGFLLLGFLAGVAGWVTGAVLGWRNRQVASRRAYLAATAVVAVALLCGATLWVPVGLQASRQDDLVAELDRLERMMPTGYQLQESDDDENVGSGFVEPRRVWTAPASARPCEQLGPVLRRWAGRAPDATPRNQYGVCTFTTTRYGWDVSVRVETDGPTEIELETSA